MALIINKESLAILKQQSNPKLMGHKTGIPKTAGVLGIPKCVFSGRRLHEQKKKKTGTDPLSTNCKRF